MSTTPFDLQVLLEQHMERQALEICRPSSFRAVMRMYDITPNLPIQSPKGVSITLHASDLFQARSKWLAEQELGQGCTALSVRGASLITGYQKWLTTSYSPRYQWLDTEMQRSWVMQVGLLVVVRHIMGEKYTRFFTTGEQTFADPWTGYVMGHLHVYHRVPTNAAHVLKSLIKDPTQRASLLDDFIAEFDIQLARHPFVYPEPLPSLPKGMHFPFSLPVPRELYRDQDHKPFHSGEQ